MKRSVFPVHPSEEFGNERSCVSQTLDDGVDETRVGVVGDADCPGLTA